MYSLPRNTAGILSHAMKNYYSYKALLLAPQPVLNNFDKSAIQSKQINWVYI